MQSSREEVLELVKRWQSENCVIKAVFCTVDHSLQITYPPMLYAYVIDNSMFSLLEAIPQKKTGLPLNGIYVKLTTADGYEIINMPHEANPQFAGRVDYGVSLRIPFGEFGDLHIYELERADPKKVM